MPRAAATATARSSAASPGKPEYAAHDGQAATNPLVIVEVLSPSSAGDDDGDKRRDFQSLTTLQAYVSGAATYGGLYIFATLDYRELSIVLRTELTLTPNLAIDLYVEPFVSTGAYTSLAELTAAGTRSLRRYAEVTRSGTRVMIDDGGATFELPEPDFTARSLRSTAVLRWEPRPGSTLYAVWQQDRGSSELRARALGPALLDTTSAAGSHTFAIKLAWWFAR